jgi:Rho-binding antiterminator
MSDYRPVDCAVHSRYEEAILLRRRLRLRWRAAEGGVREEIVEPLDVVTREGEEFLRLRDGAHQELSVRLDHILHSETVVQEKK